MKASISITFTKHTGKFSKKERSEEASFDDELCTFIGAALALIDVLDDYVKGARQRRR